MDQHRDDTHIEHLLEHHGLRKTAFRKEILGISQQRKGQALSNTEIEQGLEEWDRITLYRTLKSFEDKGLIHQTPDINGSVKYALCGHNCNAHQHDDGHAHFQCTKCHVTWCLDDAITSLKYNLPSAYKVEEVKVMLNGICASCT